MKIIALESSAVTASVAVCENELLLAQSFQNCSLTHSATLMPMAVDLLKNAGLCLAEMDVVAVAAGPGSFTGVRIGVAAAKGLAWAGDKPCAACSTLESMAWQCAHMAGGEGEVCAVMDARRGQVYNARFALRDGRLFRLCEDRAVNLDDLLDDVKKSGKSQTIVGDGAEMCYNVFSGAGLDARMVPPHLVYQSAWGVARCALELAHGGKLQSAAQVKPMYHRLSQAERERLERLKQSAERQTAREAVRGGG